MNLQQTSIKNHFENTTKKSSKINKNEVNKLLIKSFPTKGILENNEISPNKTNVNIIRNKKELLKKLRITIGKVLDLKYFRLHVYFFD